MEKGIIEEPMQEGDKDLKTISDGIKMPPQLQEAYDRVVVAGMKMMFSKESHSLMLEQLNAPGNMAQKLGEGIASLMVLMYKQSNQTMPPEVIIPAGIRLLVEAADFVKKSGKAKLSNAEVGQAIELMLSMLMEKFGVSPEVTSKLNSEAPPETAEPAAEEPAEPDEEDDE